MNDSFATRNILFFCDMRNKTSAYLWLLFSFSGSAGQKPIKVKSRYSATFNKSSLSRKALDVFSGERKLKNFIGSLIIAKKFSLDLNFLSSFLRL